MNSQKSAPSSQTILTDLPFALARSSLSFRQFNQHSLQAVGLKDLAPGLASVLHAAEDLGDCTVNSLVEATSLPNSTLTGLLDTLQKDKLIERIRNPEDGRSRIISLTSKGQQVCAKLHARHNSVMEIFQATFTSSEVSTLTQLLEKATSCMRDNANKELLAQAS